MNMKMTAVIEDNDLDQYLTENSDNQQYLELETIDKTEFKLLMKQDPQDDDEGELQCYVRAKN